MKGYPTALGWLAVLALPLMTRSHTQPLYTLITPRVMRVESEETVVVEAHDYTSPFETTITIFDFPKKNRILNQTKARLEPENGMLISAKTKVPADLLTIKGPKKQYVYVQATSSLFTLEKVVLLSFHSGYIFIQKDKPIYTPGSTVMYRLFTVGHMLDPKIKSVSVEIVNPDGIVVEKNLISSADNSGIIPRNYKIPDILINGIWKIVAKYEHGPQESFATEFEIKEYVLPNFEVILEPSQKFFYVDDNELTIDITAKFLFGQPVQGQAFALFGVMMGNVKKSIAESLRKVSIQDGKGRAKITRNMLQSRFPSLAMLLGHSIYVTVTVVTDTGSDMVHAEKSGIRIVRSPYKIIFPKTSKYFKPGLPFSLMVSVINPDGSPASQVPVRSVTPAGANSVSRADGTAQLVVNTLPGTDHLSVTVQTAVINLDTSRQSSAVWTADAYQTPGESGNYLHLTVAAAAELRSGDTVPVYFHLKNSNPATQNQIRYFTYLILSKGKVFQAGRQPRQTGQNPVIMSLPITPDLIPSFRIVAYYRIGYDEIVADSVWVDVKDTCMGTLKVTGASEQDNRDQQPQATMSLKVSGDPGAKVGLVVVDKAVYVLNKKSKLSQAKIWDTVEKSDIGCTAGGGGKDSAGVFVDAGLAFQTSSGYGTDTQCTSRSQVQLIRLSRSISDKKASKAREYRSQFLRKCCEDAMQENPMGYSCDRRTKYILEGKECIQAFLDCCNHIFGRRIDGIDWIPFSDSKRNPSGGHSFLKLHSFSSNHRKQVQSIPENIPENEKTSITLTSSSSSVFEPEPEEEDPEEDDITDDEIVSRTQFAESLLWVQETLPLETDFDGLSSKTVPVHLADSITTWEVLAISLSQTKGICVADPYEIKVKKDFFVDLRLPYSVVRYEQVVIRAVLYNYAPWNFRVSVELVYNEKICGFSRETTRSRRMFALQAGTSRAVSYTIIPLELGEVEIEVKAIVVGVPVADGVRKKLRVVPEGMKIFKNIKSILLDPKGQNSASGEQVVTIEPLDRSNIVPNTEPVILIGVTGDIVGETIENSIDGANLKHLIRVPSGCGEQNMIGLTPAVIATHYLDNTNQWERIGVERRAEAINFIKKGYSQQLAYRKKDNSYAAFTNRPSSTWLTAYVVKVFAMAYQLIAIDQQVLCGAVKWLILTKQNPDGIFKEDAPVIHGEMVGGYTGSEPEVSLTAFVVIALHEAKDICQEHVPILETSISRAGDYLAAQLERLQKSYTVAITSYALSLLGRANDGTKLISLSAGTHWPDPNSKLYTIEATSYGLLALLQLRKFDLASPVVRWLTEQRFYGGGYGSTQATIMVFQALAQYQSSKSNNQDEFLDVSIKLPSRSNDIHWRITYENAMVSRTDQTTATDGFTVSARGTGKGTLSVMAVFYVPLMEEMAPCNKFDLAVSVQNSSDAKKPEGALGSVDIEICMKFQGEADSTMTIVDISMLTGFTPDIQDLQKLTNQVDKYISKYEMDEVLSDKGSLILYLDKVSRTETECLKFKAHQYFEVGLIQPAAVTIYEYYTTENRCTKFYHPSKEGSLLNTVCQERTCRCMERKCGLKTEFTPTPRNNDIRIKSACKPEVDYVYKLYVVEIAQKGMYVYYTMRIVQVIKEGTERAIQGKTRQFISPLVCKEALSMEENREYLVWGPRSDMWDLRKEMAYLFSSHTWIELWPTSLECQQEDQQLFCQGLEAFVQHLEETGCTL